MKVSLHSQREYERKIRQIEQNLERVTQKSQLYAKENKYLKRRVKELRLGRDNWKSKNGAKRLKIKALTKGLIFEERISRHHYPLLLIGLCVKLRVEAGCSYRGICKVLLIIQTIFKIGLTKLPCANTVENWVSKMGYYCINQMPMEQSGQEVCLIVDESIKQGNERILLLLTTPWQKAKQGCLTKQDVRVCYLGGKSSWTGEKVKQEVEKIVVEKGILIRGMVSDEDNKLLKASQLLELPHLPDISHAIASCLRKTFEKDVAYQLLVKQISAYQAKSVNQDLSYLRPPRQRIKARFMNQDGFVQWGLKMVAKFTALNQKEKAFFAQLPDYQPMLNVLGQAIRIGRKVAQTLKTRGLSHQTIKLVQRYVSRSKKIVCMPKLGQKVSDNHPQALLDRFFEHLEVYFHQYEDFLSTHPGTFNVCSDIIESMFGKHKILCGTNTLLGVSQLDLELPVHCLGKQEIFSLSRVALEFTFTTDLMNWRKTHSSDNQAARRKKFFANST